MSGAVGSLQTILEDIIKEHSSEGMELMDSTLNEEIRMLVKAKIANVLLERLKSRIIDKLEWLLTKGHRFKVQGKKKD